MTRPQRLTTRSAVLVALAVAALLALAAWLVWPAPARESPTGAEVTATAGVPAAEDASPPGQPANGLPPCDPAALPPEVDEVVADVEAGGPYDHPRQDATTFHNREGLLPDEASGYYREFTVETPGLDHRGARRVVTGGPEETDPEVWFFTDDHYESFCELALP